MIFKKYETKLFIYTLLLFAALGAGIIFFIKQWYIYEVLILPILTWLFYNFYTFHLQTNKEIIQFVEAIRYRDFSRHYNEREGTQELNILRAGFNEMSKTYRAISREKETQFQYLKNVLELVDTGILSYDTFSGEVGWINESFKQMLQLPYLKNVFSLTKRFEYLASRILSLQAGEHEVCPLMVDKTSYRILISATTFQTEHKTYKLIAFQNTGQVLDESETNAWQKLLRVMTHEIMNSVAPISSLAHTLSHLLDDAAIDDDKETWRDMKACIETIKNRSDGLLKFTDTYRNLNKINSLTCKETLIRDLFETIYNLMLPTLEQKNIAFEIILKDPGLRINMDSNLVEQALINLVLNAVDAVKDSENPCITLSAYNNPDNHKQVIKITDNGHGIEKEIADKIFVPFFTTKKNGNGIGLSLCRQIMMLHKGNIDVQSEVSVGTAFVLQFQN